MSLPAIVLSLIIASLYAGVFHFLFARQAVELVYYWPAAVIGFLLGAAIGLLIHWDFMILGEIHLFEGTLAATLVLLLARWLCSTRKLA